MATSRRMSRKTILRGVSVGFAAIAVFTGFVITQRGGPSNPPSVPAASPTRHVAVVDVTAGPIQILDATVKPTVNDVAALYFTVRNSGPADRIIAAETDASPRATLHSEVTTGNTGSMVQLQSLPIAAETTTLVSPGGYHVMLEQVPKPITVGQTVRCTLTFEHAGKLTFDAPVTPY